MSETVLYEVDGAVATITLNRPEKLNAMNLELLAEVVHLLEAVASDPVVRVVILTGAGRAFCAGGDLGVLAGGGAAAAGVPEGESISVDGAVSRLMGHARSSQLLHDMSKITIAAVNGPCVGAGLGWATACDLRFASEKASFNTAFVAVGVSGDMGGHWTLPRIVGPAKARELYLLGERIDAEEAYRINLVSKVVPHDELMPYVKGVAEQLAARAPLTLQAIKANQNEAPELPFGEMLDRESERHVRLGFTEDAKEAASAFVEKRPPVFRGR